MAVLNLDDADAVGSVTSVDTGTVVVDVGDPEHLRRLKVNHLVAVRSSLAGQHHIGLITKITRRALLSPPAEEDDDSVQDAVSVVENIIKVTLVGTLLDRVGSRSNVLRRTLESVPEIDALCFALEGPNLTSFMQAITASVEEGRPSLRIGTYTLDERAEAWLDANRFFQRHAVIVGGTGSGKSWTVARLLEQISELPMANCLLFDIHGEYATVKAKGIEHLRIVGPADVAVEDDTHGGPLALPYWLLTYEEMLALLLDRSDANAPNQAMLFARAVTEAKTATLEELEKSAALANFTIDSPVPYRIEQVLERLSEQNTEMVPGARSGTQKQGPFYGKLSRFIQRLEAKVDDRRLAFLFPRDPASLEYEWFEGFARRLMCPSQIKGGGGVKIIDFSEVPSDILPLVLGLVARCVFSVQQWTRREVRHPIALFCDEAHLYIVDQAKGDAVLTEALRAFERIAKEGRKYGVGLVIISQRPADVNRTVLSQSMNYVAMRLTNAEDQSVVRRLLPDSLGGFAEVLPVLDIGEALVVGDACLLPSRIRLDKPNMKPTSATVDFWDRWSETQGRDGIPAAVEALRRQAWPSD